MENIFTLEDQGEDLIIKSTLPQGKTQEELISQAFKEITESAKRFYGKNVKFDGRMTTGMALSMGHILAHLCKSVSIFDPKENRFVLCVAH